jgi:hypothetical protein
MGWSEGSLIVSNMAEVILSCDLKPEQRHEILNALVLYVLANDCDTIDECRGMDPVLDAIIDEQWGSDEE